MYPVSDMQRAARFYQEDLGLKKEGLASDYWIEFDIGGGTFGIGNFEQVGAPGTAQALCLEIEGLDDFRSRLAQRGIESTDPHDLQACRISMVRDPDGNQVWLHERKRG